MITKAQIKHIQSLSDKKYRYEHRQFVVEGEKMVAEALLSGFQIEHILAGTEWLAKSGPRFPKWKIEEVQPFEMDKMSALQTSPQILAVVHFPEEEKINIEAPLLMLEDLQDPGNMGTLLRIADWFNVKDIICSPATVDHYNPKSIQASMGSIFRTRVHYTPLSPWLTSHPNLPVYATAMQGENLKNMKPVQQGVFVFGSESKGISDELLSMIPNKVHITGSGQAESLNVAVAAGIVCFHLLS